MLDLALHRGQFVLGGDPPVGFLTATIGSRPLHHSPELPLHPVTDASGTEWLLLGHPIQADEEPSPAAAVSGSSTSGVPSAYMSWAGRWVLVSQDEVHGDGMGLFAIYYDDKVLSSSPALLRPSRKTVVQLGQSDKVNWFPPPRSGFPDVRRLLPSQVLRLDTMCPAPRRLTVDLPNQPYEAVLDRLEGLLLHTVEQAWGERNLLPLTAGFDSRLLLSAAAHLQLPVLCFTQVHALTISRADLAIPPQLASACGYEHQLIRRARRFDQQGADLYSQQAAGHVREVDRVFLGHGQFDFLQKGDLLLRGLALEIGRAYYYGYDELDERLAIEQLDAVLHPDAYRRAALQEWLSWVAAHPEPIDDRDRLYWEQRVAGWVGASELALDLLPAERFTPAACPLFASLLLQVPLEKRLTSQHHVDLIRRLQPRLLDWPFNPPESRWRPRPITAALLRRVERRRSAARNN